NALQEEAAKRFETTESRLTVLWNRLRDIAITVGESLNPTLNEALGRLEPFLGALERAADWFANLDPAIRTVIVVVGGLLAALGPLLVTLSIVISSLGALASTFGIAVGAMLLLVSKVALVIAALGALVAGI